MLNSKALYFTNKGTLCDHPEWIELFERDIFKVYSKLGDVISWWIWDWIILEGISPQGSPTKVCDITPTGKFILKSESGSWELTK